MNKKNFTCADAILKTIIEYWNIDTIFWYPWWAAIPLYNSLDKFKDKVKHILPASEQWAGFMAQGYTRSTWKNALTLVTSWPWFTNVVTPLGDAYMDSIPMLVVSGQVPRHMIWKNAFQEINAIWISKHISKYFKLIDDPNKVVYEIVKALNILVNWRPWPVHLDIPKDVLLAEHPESFEFPDIDSYSVNKFEHTKNDEISPEKIEELKKLIWESKRPILLIWQWTKYWKSPQKIKKLIGKLNIPTVYTLLAKWVVDDKNENILWMLWMHWFYHANMAVHNSDLLINIWSRFDDRIVWTYTNFWKNKKVAHIDIDDKELWRLVSTNLSIRSDAESFIDIFSRNLWENPKLDIESWIKQIKKWQKEKPYIIEENIFWTKQILNSINKYAEKNCIYTVDVWQHQMWAAQILDIKDPKNWLSSSWLWTMWFSLPSAIWVAIANPWKQVVSISGDWWFQMNLPELTILLSQYPKINIKIVIIDNSSLWMVRQWQDMFDENTRSNVDISSPDYMKIAESYWIKWYKIESSEQMEKYSKEIYWEKWPSLIWYKVKKEENVFPMVPAWMDLDKTIVE